MEPKIIIYVKNGIVAALHANMDLTYVVIDHDPNATLADDEIIVGHQNEPDSVDSDINLDKALEYLDIPAAPSSQKAKEIFSFTRDTLTEFLSDIVRNALAAGEDNTKYIEGQLHDVYIQTKINSINL